MKTATFGSRADKKGKEIQEAAIFLRYRAILYVAIVEALYVLEQVSPPKAGGLPC